MNLTRIVLFGFSLLLAKVAAAEEDPAPTAKVVVDVSPPTLGQRWIAEALENNAYRQLSSFRRIAAVDKRDIVTGSPGFDRVRFRHDLAHNASAQNSEETWAWLDNISINIVDKGAWNEP